MHKKSLNLYPHQKEGKALIYDAFKKPDVSCVVYRLETGGGKTIIMASITQDLYKRNGRVLLIVHRVELLRQLVDKLNKFGIDCGVIAPGHPEINKRIQVASIDTLISRLKRKQFIEWKEFNPNLIMVDEGHHVIADNKWGRALTAMGKPDKLPNILLVTATPARTDGTGLGDGHGGFADMMVEGPECRWLIDNGYLSDYRIFLANVVDMTGVRKNPSGDYSISKLESKMLESRALVGDAIQEYGDYGAGPALVFESSVKLAKKTAEDFCNAGFKFKSLDGSMSDSDRKGIIDALTDGRLDGITSCEVVSEGTDIPRVEKVFKLRPTMSFVLNHQQDGRGLRTFKGKENCMIFDHVGNAATVMPDGQLLERHGFPDDEVTYSLESGVIKKKRSKSDDEKLNLRRCPKCDCIHAPRPECPECGYEYTGREIKVMSGELQELERKQKQQEEIKKKRDVKLEQGRQRSVEQLIRFAESKHRNPMWAYYVHHSRGEKQLPNLKRKLDYLIGQYEFYKSTGSSIQASSYQSDIDEVRTQIDSFEMSKDEFMKIVRSLS